MQRPHEVLASELVGSLRLELVFFPALDEGYDVHVNGQHLSALLTSNSEPNPNDSEVRQWFQNVITTKQLPQVEPDLP